LSVILSQLDGDQPSHPTFWGGRRAPSRRKCSCANKRARLVLRSEGSLRLLRRVASARSTKDNSAVSKYDWPCQVQTSQLAFWSCFSSQLLANLVIQSFVTDGRLLCLRVHNWRWFGCWSGLPFVPPTGHDMPSVSHVAVISRLTTMYLMYHSIAQRLG
jgi:hypothetical protein